MPGGYICYWCTTKRATDTDSIISSPGPNDWRGTDFTSTEIPAKTLRQLGSTHPFQKRQAWSRGRGRQASVEKQGWKPRLISHECSEVVAYALQTLPQPLLFLCFLLSCTECKWLCFIRVTKQRQWGFQRGWLVLGHVSCGGFLVSW